MGENGKKANSVVTVKEQNSKTEGLINKFNYYDSIDISTFRLYYDIRIILNQTNLKMIKEDYFNLNKMLVKCFPDKIYTKKNHLAEKPGEGTCSDTCKTCREPELQSFRIYGKDNPRQVYAGENNKLLRLLAIGEKLKEQGHKFNYYALNQDPGAFVCEPAAMECIEGSESMEFPLTVSEGIILKSGAYPDQEDFLAWTGLEISRLDLQGGAEIQAIAACETVRTIVCLNSEDCFTCRGCFLSESTSPKTAAGFI